jgi:hypothetical protein
LSEWKRKNGAFWRRAVVIKMFLFRYRQVVAFGAGADSCNNRKKA